MSRDTVMVQGGILMELLDSCDIEQLRRSPIRFKACSPLDMKGISKIFSMAFRSDPETLLRPYPSGGRIYPIELFFLDLSSSQPEPLHYLHNRHAFERLSSECSDWESALLGPQHPWGEPVAALIYVLNLPKSLVKYRYRGYRLALIEAGCMMQQGSTAVVEVGLRDRITNAFSDNELAACLGLNPACFLPIAVQIIGKPGD
ncbi:SagB/ThcOx family dehydrogenase [Halomonas caseinilytica]|nr:SagB/ThcOx family dehydrogenase [Halomonas caseinilytica]